MAHAGGQVSRDDVTMIGKRGPRGGTTLKSAAVSDLLLKFDILLSIIFKDDDLCVLVYSRLAMNKNNECLS